MIARYLLRLIFLMFGFNGLLHFILMPPPMGGRHDRDNTATTCPCRRVFDTFDPVRRAELDRFGFAPRRRTKSVLKL